MTWTNTHTIPWTSINDNPAALAYHFDTYLPAKGWTTGAHPDASAFKRKFSWTATDNFTNTSQTSYFWTTWSSNTSTSSATIYEDATYTTVPGDLCTSTTNGVSMSMSSSYAHFTSDWRFWTSDQNPNATLVTRNKKIVWFHQGYSNYNYVQQGVWTGANQNPNTHIFPLVTESIMFFCNAPVDTGTTSSESYLYFSSYFGSSYSTLMPETFYSNFSVDYYNTAVNFRGPAFIINQSDIKYHSPASGGAGNRTLQSSNSQNGVLLLANGRYWLRGDPNMNNNSIVLDMGVSEPDLT